MPKERLLTTSFNLLSTAIVFTLLGSGCTSEQIYNTGQTWQNIQCEKIADQDVRKRCLESNTNTNYDTYQRQTQENVR
jgi:hypothetical protein